MSIYRIILFCSLILQSALGIAQSTVSVIDGTDHEVIPYATVKLIDATGAIIFAKPTDGSGKAAFSVDELGVSEGLMVHAEALGYRTGSVPLSRSTTIALQPSRNELGALIVTGQYAPMHADDAVQRVRVIDQDRMQKLAANSLSDALRNELNIRLSQDNILGTSMSMQGLGGENVKILIDGVPVIGRQNGNIDLSQMDLNGIERVEVVEGPLSVSYGSNALAGTINLITKKNANEAPHLKLSSYAEQIGRLNLWGTLSKRWGKHNVNFNVGRDYFNGWNPGRNGIPDFSPSLADTTRYQQWKPREQYTGRFNYRWNAERWQLGYKAEASTDLITSRGLPRAPYYESAFDERYRTQRYDNALFADRLWQGGRKFSLIAAHNRFTRTRNTWARDLTTLGEQLMVTDGMQDTSRFSLSNVRAVYYSASEGAKLRYEFGVDLNYETGAGQRIVQGAGASIGDYAWYSSIEYRPWRSVVVRPALRYAYNTVYGAPLVPSFNVRWQVDTAFTARASYARGFRTPSIKELYFYFVDVNHDIQGNTELNAEYSNNFSGSLAWNKPQKRGAWRAELSGFYNTVNDLITLAQVNTTLYTYVNIGHYRTTGGNLGLSWEGEKWSYSVGANTTGRYDDIARAQNGSYLWSNEVRGSVSRTWKKQGLTAQVFFKRQGTLNTYALRENGNVERNSIQAFDMADASVTKDLFKKKLAVTLGCKNLFDIQNINTNNTFTTGIHTSGGNSVPMMTGRVFFLRLILELNGKQK